MQLKLQSLLHDDKNLENQENFINLVLKMQKLLRLFRMRNLSIIGKITVFKTPAVSKMVHLALVKVILISNILELDKIMKYFIWKMAILKSNKKPFVNIIKRLKKTLALRLKELLCNFLWLNDFGNFQDIIKKLLSRLNIL